MTYSREAQALIDAVQSGDCCPECFAPNDQRHFDDCSRHPLFMACPECDASMEPRQQGTFNAHWECPFDQQVVWPEERELR